MGAARRARRIAEGGAGAEAVMARSRRCLADQDLEGAIATIERGLPGLRDPGRLYVLKGLLNQKLGRASDAVADLTRALEYAPRDPMVFHALGVLAAETGRSDAAAAHFEQALRLDPDNCETLFRLAEVLRNRGAFAAAIPLLYRAASLAPDRLDVAWMACWARMHACDWRNHAARTEALLALALRKGEPISPFLVLALGRPPDEARLWARAWIASTLPAARPRIAGEAGSALPPAGTRVRLGYVSADLKDHAVPMLVADLIESHDRTRFEVCGYNIGTLDNGALCRRVTGAFDRFVDLTGLGDEEAARRIAADGVTILVDLNGHTNHARPGIFACRPAPIQVNFLGFPGSMGMREMDYLIADPVVVPERHRPFYDEAIVRLPHSYQPNDRRRAGADPGATRAAHGLPPDAFVFCCFNNAYKLTPALFAIWMRLLRELPGAVLWLLGGHREVEANLRGEAARSGIDPGRLVFAARVPAAEHIGRMRLGDLFLDTLPYGGHTTASEALWAGLPVLTCLGEAFAGRVAASLLTAIGLPELIAEDLGAYERTASSLARDPARLAAVRATLARNREIAPLFDTPRYVRNFEAALLRMVSTARAGGSPEPFDVVEDAAARAESAFAFGAFASA